MDFHPHLTAFLRHLAEDRRLSTSTVEGYREELELLLRRADPMAASTLPSFVSRDIHDRLLAPTTRNRRLAIVRGFVRYLLSERVLKADPTERLQRARVPPSTRVGLQIADIRRILSTLRAGTSPALRIRDEAILLILFYTGMRVAELVALDVSQVDLGAFVLRHAKRKGGGRTDVILHPSARAALMTWLASRTDSGPAVFPRGNTGRLTTRAVQKRMKALGEAAGLRVSLHPHALRHAHATALLSVGVSTELIRQSMNHSSLATTQRYLHADRTILREALARLPDMSSVPC